MKLPILFRIAQAFAELETDTPGQIYGITYKQDGKSKQSSSPNDSNGSKESTSFWSKQTQGERQSDYTEHDRSGDEKHQIEKSVDEKSYYVIGGMLFIVFAMYLFQNRDSSGSRISLNSNFSYIDEQEFQELEKQRLKDLQNSTFKDA